MSSLKSSPTIMFDWPAIQIPTISLSRLLLQKLFFYNEQKFLIDSVNQSTFCYKHVLLDCLRTVQIFKSNKITAGCVIGINGFDDYEHVVTLLAALLVQCQIVLLDRNLNKEQISCLIEQCRISHLIFNNKHKHTVNKGDVKVKHSYSISFGKNTADTDLSRKYLIDQTIPFRSNYLGWQIPDKSKNCLLIPIFKRGKFQRIHFVQEQSLLAQLLYATLPDSGFEWNINDIVLPGSPLSTLLGVYELLATLLTGAQIVINTNIDGQLNPTRFASLVKCHNVTTSIIPSWYLLSISKSELTLNGSLQKLLYIGKPVHIQIVSLFKNKLNISSCRYIFFLLEANGVAAIETSNNEKRVHISITPMPLMKIKVMNLNANCSLGKIFIQSPYCSKPDHWFFTGFVGHSDNQKSMQIIDKYVNLLPIGGKYISKTILKTAMVGHRSVKNAKIHLTRNHKNPSRKAITVSVTLLDGSKSTQQELNTYLDTFIRLQYENDLFRNINWKVVVEDK